MMKLCAGVQPVAIGKVPLRGSTVRKPARRVAVTAAAVNSSIADVARTKLIKLMDETHCNPILIRAAWHDSGSYGGCIHRQLTGGECLNCV